jgi:hypothetical protein
MDAQVEMVELCTCIFYIHRKRKSKMVCVYVKCPNHPPRMNALYPVRMTVSYQSGAHGLNVPRPAGVGGIQVRGGGIGQFWPTLKKVI